MKERWLMIPDYPNYEASNMGRIRSIDHFVSTNLRNVPIVMRKGIILKQRIYKDYYFIGMRNNGKFKNLSVHRLVAKTWVKPVIGKDYINHKNGVKTDNRSINLEWVTCKENTAHAVKNGLMKFHKGEKARYSKLTDKQRKAVIIRCGRGESQRSIATFFGVTQGTISNIIRNFKKASYG